LANKAGLISRRHNRFASKTAESIIAIGFPIAAAEIVALSGARRSRESGLAWYDTGAKNLELVLGVQSPYETAKALAYVLGNARVPCKPTHIKTLFAYMGGGFGGRDHTPFPLYVALAAIFLPGRPRNARVRPRGQVIPEVVIEAPGISPARKPMSR
jgi:hypothetical protein